MPRGGGKVKGANQMNERLRRLGDQIATLTVDECWALTEYLRNTHAMHHVQLIYPWADEDCSLRPMSPDADMELILESCPVERRVPILREIRQIKDYSLREALDFSRRCPVSLGVFDSYDIQRYQNRLEAAGALVSIRSADDKI